MGWSEKYWDDVKSELELGTAELEPTPKDEAPDYAIPPNEPVSALPIDTPDQG